MKKAIREAELLKTIQSPADLKKIPFTLLPRLAREIREKIIDVVSRNGGHLASNLGVVELTLILHRVFDSPKDKIIWDVGHQCYTHKLITGRGDSIGTIRLKNGISGFPKQNESVHDVAETGHASTSISSALGILIGQELQKTQGRVIAVIGDGSLSGGMALEGLNHAGHIGKNLLIVLNDNQMSISPNVGALSSYLSRITTTRMYQRIRRRIDTSVKRIPLFGGKLMNLIIRIKKGIKAIFLKETLFSDLGFEYVGPIDGHNLGTLTSVFKNVKEFDKPMVVHVVTKKGIGYPHSEGDPTLYHGVAPFSIIDGKIEKKSSLTFTEAFSQAVVDLAESDERIVAITAAMAKGTGLALFEERFPDRFFDVGITEQHAVTFAGGLAIAGMKPILTIYSTFLQRSIDQVIHDIALPGLPVIIIADRAGLVGGDGETHQGLYDLAFLRSVGGLTILSPASAEELIKMLSFAIDHSGPVLIRYPKAACYRDEALKSDLELGKGVFLRHSNEQTLLLSTGGLVGELMEAGNTLSREGTNVDIYNLRFLKPFDEEYLLNILSSYKRVLLFEDGIEYGGFGEGLGNLIQQHNIPVDYSHFGVPEAFSARGTREELLSECGLDSVSIVKIVRKLLPVRRFYRLRAAPPFNAEQQ